MDLDLLSFLEILGWAKQCLEGILGFYFMCKLMK